MANIYIVGAYGSKFISSIESSGHYVTQHVTLHDNSVHDAASLAFANIHGIIMSDVVLVIQTLDPSVMGAALALRESDHHVVQLWIVHSYGNPHEAPDTPVTCAYACIADRFFKTTDEALAAINDL